VVPEVPTEDQHRRSDKDGRFLYTCAICGRMFRHRRNLGSEAGPRISVCGALLNPPEARCMMVDDFGEIWWPKDEPMPDLLEIDRWLRELEAARTMGLGEREAVKLLLELDDDADFFRELLVNWHEAGGPRYLRRFASDRFASEDE
jgi:hypothetical protein